MTKEDSMFDYFDHEAMLRNALEGLWTTPTSKAIGPPDYPEPVAPTILLTAWSMPTAFDRFGDFAEPFAGIDEIATDAVNPWRRTMHLLISSPFIVGGYHAARATMATRFVSSFGLGVTYTGGIPW